ncbi:hypothetical protein GCU60_00705 [Blastococcus saxobsidens]|uniref:Uncharacterized protein n=1 Tax=Blastococcus saxobsidens TaxID=138336 RepID=A0A6L9VX08_9ACTN|nr:hypothetical protein [Blastococcus saxobsidens]NEK84297.1 hypothetical protein [Blastococcus saxobsidens]
MPTYRLLSGLGEKLTCFDADDDRGAVARGRELAADHPQPPALDSGQPVEPVVRGDFRVERRDGHRWSLVRAWVPFPDLPPQDC